MSDGISNQNTDDRGPPVWIMIACMLLLPWIALYKGAGHYAFDKSIENKFFLDALVNNGPIGIVLSSIFLAQFALLMLTMSSIANIFIPSNGFEKTFNYSIVILNIVSLYIILTYDTSNPPAFSAALYSITCFSAAFSIIIGFFISPKKE